MNQDDRIENMEKRITQWEQDKIESDIQNNNQDVDKDENRQDLNR